MGHPKESARWATNAVYASPGESWDGNPTKVEPPTGKIDEGWEPTEEAAAQFQNDWQNKVGLLTDYLRLIQPKNWELLRDPIGSTEEMFSIGYDASTGTFIASGTNPDLSTMVSRDGGVTWVKPGVTVPANAVGQANGIDADGAGNWVIAGLSGDISHSSDDGETWATVAVPGAGFGSDVRFDPISGLWVMITGTPAEVHTSPDRTTWTQRFTNAAVATTRDIDISPAGVAVVTTTGAGGGNGSTLRSVDMLTWVETVLPAPAGVNLGSDGVVFSQGSGLWFVTARSAAAVFALFSSSDGTTFTEVAGNNLSVTAGRKLGGDDGEMLLAGFGNDLSNDGGEVHVSTDRGVTWLQVAGIGAGLARGPLDSRALSGGGTFKGYFRHLAQRFYAPTQNGGVWRTRVAL